MGLSETLFINPEEIGTVQVIFLMLVYGYILSQSSALISDGSELLLLIPSLAGIVGSVVLPVLGAVPDGAIVLFSGLGPDADAQITVGVGALAGSTIMLLTIPWALCIISGRVDIVNGEANYKGKPKLTRGYDMFHTGVTPRPSVGTNAKIMIGTAISYVIIQIAAFSSHCGTASGSDCVASHEHWVALVALLISIACFVGYLYYNIKNADSEDNEDFIGEVKKQAIESHMISISAAFESDLKTKYGEGDRLKHDDTQFKSALKSFFSKYDRDGNGVIDAYELRVLLDDLNEDMTEERFASFLKEIDTDGSGTVSFKEFEVAMKEYIRRKNENPEGHSIPLSIQSQSHGEEHKHKAEGEEEEEEEEEEEVPEDIAALPAHQQKLRILLRSAWMMGLGTIIVLAFSDPMVDVLNTVGERFHVKPFYVAFVLAPVASNASELIASIAYATKKTKKTITISLAALEGAACMNNTFCLGIFLLLIFAKGLAWKFSAETIAIIFVEVALFVVGAFVRTQKLWLSGAILSLYPISIFLVWFLENVAGLN